MVWSQNFHFIPCPDSRATRTKQRATRTHAQNPDRHSTSPFDFDFKSHPDHTFRLCRRTQRPGSHAFNFADFARLRLRRLRTPSTSPRLHPKIACLRLRRLHTLRLRQLHTPSTSPRWHRDGTDRTEIAIKKWLGFDEFDRICVYLLRNGIIY